MNNVQTAVTAIRAMDNDELTQVIEAVKLQRNWLSRRIARSMMVGDLVEFKNRLGDPERGRVTKVNRKTVIVDAGYTRWKVPATMLTVVEAV